MSRGQQICNSLIFHVLPFPEIVCRKWSTLTVSVVNLSKPFLFSDFCFPVRVESSNDVGNYLVASKDIQPLELIILDPVATPQGPLHDDRRGSPVCLGCYEPLERDQLCQRCRLPLCALCEGVSHHKDYECRFFTEKEVAIAPDKFNQKFNAVS